MVGYRVSESAGRRIDDIYRYTQAMWGDAQADRYIRGLFGAFDDIASRSTAWRAIPAELGVDGYYRRHERHYIYWRLLSDGAVGIVTILHGRMHQIDRFRDDSPT